MKIISVNFLREICNKVCSLELPRNKSLLRIITIVPIVLSAHYQNLSQQVCSLLYSAGVSNKHNFFLGDAEQLQAYRKIICIHIFTSMAGHRPVDKVFTYCRTLSALRHFAKRQPCYN